MALPISLLLWLYMVAILLTAAIVTSKVTLTQLTTPRGAVCPGQELVYSCNSTVSIQVLWREKKIGTDLVFSETIHIGITQIIILQFFMIQFVNQATNPFSIVSTATLKNALFSHNNSQIECFSTMVSPVLSDSAIVLVSGASTHPTNITLVPQSADSVLLSWLPPPDDNNCSFTYAVNSTSNGSLVAQYRTNTTSLTVTDLSVATMYHFAVAVEDASLTTGPWSEIVDILWDAPQKVINISIVMKADHLEVNWMMPQIENIPHPPIIDYKIIHNLTASGNITMVSGITSLVAVIPLNGVPPGHYYVAVAARNIVGLGKSNRESVTVAAPSQSAIISTPTSSSSHSMQKLSSAMNYGTSHVIKFTSSCSTVTFINTSPLLSNTLEASPVIVGVLVSGVVVSAIITAIVTSIIMWCVMRRPPSPAGTGTGTGTADDDKGVTELATVIYDTPHVIKEHNDQSAISTQDNVAYGGTIPHKKQNEDYEQVHIN